MKLMQVKGRWILNWPPSILGTYEVPKRGTAGYVVDMDAPLEASLFCKGQEYKLGAAPKGATASAVTHARAKQMLAEHAKKNAPKVVAKAASASPSGRAIQADLPSVDLPKKTPAKV